MAESELRETTRTKGPRMLPRVTLTNGKTYFIDERLNQLRNITDPFDYIDNYMDTLDRDDADKVKCNSHQFTDFITIRCGFCSKVLFTGTEKQAKGLIIYCTDCASK